MLTYISRTNRKFLSLPKTLKDDSSHAQRKYTHIPERKKKTLYIYTLFGNCFRDGFYRRKRDLGQGSETKRKVTEIIKEVDKGSGKEGKKEKLDRSVR